MYFVVDTNTGDLTYHNTKEEALNYIKEEYKYDVDLDGVHLIKGKELTLIGDINTLNISSND